MVLDYTEAKYLEKKAIAINFEPNANIVDELNDTASVEVCIEDYNFVMMEANFAPKMCGNYDFSMDLAALVVGLMQIYLHLT